MIHDVVFFVGSFSINAKEYACCRLWTLPLAAVLILETSYCICAGLRNTHEILGQGDSHFSNGSDKIVFLHRMWLIIEPSY